MYHGVREERLLRREGGKGGWLFESIHMGGDHCQNSHSYSDIGGEVGSGAGARVL